jgi:hypothetical protein
MPNPRDQISADLDAHGRSIDDLHHKLAATPGIDRDRLKAAVDKYKGAHTAFCDDALGCMN